MKKIIEKIREDIKENPLESVKELIEFAKIPNNVFDPNQIQTNASFLVNAMKKRGIQVEIWDTPSGRPLIFGEFFSNIAEKTILMYGHYDGVPVEPEKWLSDPYEPVIREGLTARVNLPFDNCTVSSSNRLFARSIADSKNAIIAMLAALDHLEMNGIKSAVNIKFLFDGEEEVESPSLPACLEKYKDKLASDIVISASGELHQSGFPTVELGFRGILLLELAVYTMNQELHSGHFGNFAPNAIMKMNHLLSTFKDKSGLVTIKGFYDDIVPLSDAEFEAIRRIPKVEERILNQFGICKPEIKAMSLQQLINLPTLNIRGMSGGGIGQQASNIIPNKCHAEIDIRLVKGMEPNKVYQQLIDHIRLEGFKVVTNLPTYEDLINNEHIIYIEKKAGFPATRISLESKEANYVINSLRNVADSLIVLPTEGGSLPLYLFEKMGIPVIGLPTSNYDCNQHTHNENLIIDYYFRGIETFVALFLGN